MPALIIGKDIEELIRCADAIIVARVDDVQTPVLEAPPYQVRRSKDLIPMNYRYHVSVEEVLGGDLSQSEMDISFYDRSNLKVSYVETGSGIETTLKNGERYLLILQKMPDSHFEFVRAEGTDKKEQILRILRDNCD